ncbi:MAG: hypothetical protein OXC91_06935 [Rhodobacteraceae bacterium]|nr:hypothetical protein [Paracoccaceae bacterium]
MRVFHCTSNRPAFLLLGLWKNYDPGDGEGHHEDRILEGEGARAARRNNLALASIVVAAGLAGAGPQDLEVFGVRADGSRAVVIVSVMLVACHVYWYVMRWQHLCDGAEILVFSMSLKHEPLSLWQESPRQLRQKSAALVANRVCFILVAISVTLSAWWGVGTLLPSP